MNKRRPEHLSLVAFGNYNTHGIKLGEGNFARVFFATHQIVGNPVALKIYDTAANIEDYVLRNLEREAKILAKLNHPNIVKLYETLMCNRFYCLALECVPYGTLKDYIKIQRGQRLPEDDAKVIFTQILSAIGHIHSCGILHRDLKLENVMMVDSHFVKLVDFGLSNFYDPKKQLQTRCGSPEYAAPELFTPGVTYGPAIDMWSSGVILYAMMLGSVPFAYPTACSGTVDERRKILHAQCSKGLVEAHFEAMNFLSKDCRDLIRSLLEPNQSNRLQLEPATNHIWLKGVTNPALSAKEISSDRLKDIHNIVMNKLSLLTRISVSELQSKIQNGRFNEYYAMYHLKRDSILNSFVAAERNKFYINVNGTLQHKMPQGNGRLMQPFNQTKEKPIIHHTISKPPPNVKELNCISPRPIIIKDKVFVNSAYSMSRTPGGTHTNPDGQSIKSRHPTTTENPAKNRFSNTKLLHDSNIRKTNRSYSAFKKDVLSAREVQNQLATPPSKSPFENRRISRVIKHTETSHSAQIKTPHPFLQSSQTTQHGCSTTPRDSSTIESANEEGFVSAPSPKPCVESTQSIKVQNTSHIQNQLPQAFGTADRIEKLWRALQLNDLPPFCGPQTKVHEKIETTQELENSCASVAVSTGETSSKVEMCENPKTDEHIYDRNISNKTKKSELLNRNVLLKNLPILNSTAPLKTIDTLETGSQSHENEMHLENNAAEDIESIHKKPDPIENTSTHIDTIKEPIVEVNGKDDTPIISSPGTPDSNQNLRTKTPLSTQKPRDLELGVETSKNRANLSAVDIFKTLVGSYVKTQTAPTVETRSNKQNVTILKRSVSNHHSQHASSTANITRTPATVRSRFTPNNSVLSSAPQRVYHTPNRCPGAQNSVSTRNRGTGNRTSTNAYNFARKLIPNIRESDPYGLKGQIDDPQLLQNLGAMTIHNKANGFHHGYHAVQQKQCSSKHGNFTTRARVLPNNKCTNGSYVINGAVNEVCSNSNSSRYHAGPWHDVPNALNKTQRFVCYGCESQRYAHMSGHTWRKH